MTKEELKNYKHAWYIKNKLRILNNRANYYLHNKEQYKKYCIDNKDRIALYGKIYRESNKKYYKEYRSNYYKKNKTKLDLMVKEYKIKNKLGTKYSYVNRKRYPEKFKSKIIYDRAIRNNKIQRGVCIVCGTGKTHGHHEDYTKPLEVIWLCPKHHSQLHTSKKYAYIEHGHLLPCNISLI